MVGAIAPDVTPLDESVTLHPIRAIDVTKYPELHHYTNWSGLEGIWNSGVLFATRYDQLNDVEEIHHFRSLLSSLLRARIGPWMLERATGDAAILLALEKGGGAAQVATDFARIIVEALYKASFEESTAGPPHAVPYITSFCGHGPEQSYERQSGLLSQWRAYGQEQERFAIVFDTAALQEALVDEASNFIYAFAHFAEVAYDDGSIDPSTAYKNLFAAAEQFYPMLLDNLLGGAASASGRAGALIVPFLEAACTMKHRGFKEELEVRIVACPMTSEHFARMREPEKKVNAGRVVKSVCSRKSGRDASEVAFIRLFERRGGQRLPIKRLIVGPLRDQDAARKNVERLVKGEVPIVLSSTPFVG